jgi:hypothetical protein
MGMIGLPHGCFNIRHIATCTDWVVDRRGLIAGQALPEFKHFSRQWTALQIAGMKGLKRKCSHLSFGFEMV